MADVWFKAGDSSSDASLLLSASAPPPPPQVKATYELRPLTTGEILDRTFYLYRTNFWLFVGISAIAAAVTTLTSLGKLVYLHLMSAKGPVTPLYSSVLIAISIVSGVLYFVVYSVAHAATTSAVTAIYLGDATSMRQAFKAVTARWLRYSMIALWQIWSASWLFAVLLVPAIIIFGLGIGSKNWLASLFVFVAFGGLIYGFIAYIRNSFAVPAAVMENLGIRAALKRSKQLTAGTKGRIFLLFLFVLALYFVAVAIQTPLTVLIVQKKTAQVFLMQALVLLVGFFTGSVIGPVGAIGLCLFYIDQRIRKEGFDIEFLIDRSATPAPPVQLASDPVEIP